MNIILCAAKTAPRYKLTLKCAKALQYAKSANAAIHPGNYLEHHLSDPISTRRGRAEALTNRYERLILNLNGV